MEGHNSTLTATNNEVLFKISATDILGGTKPYLLIVYLGLLIQSGTMMAKKKNLKVMLWEESEYVFKREMTQGDMMAVI